MKNVNERNKLITMLVGCVGALMIILAQFLPYATATEKQEARLKLLPEAVVYEEIGKTNEGLINISMVEYAQIYGGMSEKLFGDAASGFLYVGMVALIGVFSLLTLLFTVKRKPIGAIVFSVLTLLVVFIQNWDYSDRRVIPSNSYDWGIAYYLCFVAVVLMIVGNVLMFIFKKKEKVAKTITAEQIM